MKEKHNKINRRNFLKTMGAAGLGSVLTGCESRKESEPNAVDANAPAKAQEPQYPQVPKRMLGKTGVKVPCLCLGTLFNLVDNQMILKNTLRWGVTYWDTAHNYAGGNSELGIGKFLSKNPDVRKKLFLVTKASRARTVAQIEERLQSSLKRMNTKYIDLYYGVHILSDPGRLTDELKRWAENAKKRNLIRFFGFSTHDNMAQCLAAAARLDWIDAILTRYDFRLMQDAEMQAAIEACHKAGIGLTAMKPMAGRQRIETEKDKKLAKHFLDQGFTEPQAKIKVVLEDKRFSAACTRMQNTAHLRENVAAALDKTKLSRADMEVFKEYARATCDGYCAGCANICNSALRKSTRERLTAESIGLPDTPCVSDIMRYLMYYNSYGEHAAARELFAQIPHNVRNKLLSTDYRPAEARCPQHLPIAELVAEAISKLA